MPAGKIRSYHNLTAPKVKKITRDFNRRVKGKPAYWREKEKSRYGTLIEIEEPQKFRSPFEIKKHDRRPWITLSEAEMPLDKSQLAIRFGASDSLGALKGLLEKYAVSKKLKEKEPLLKLMKATGDLAEKSFLKKLDKKEKKELESSLAQIMISILILSSKYDVELYEAALKEIIKKEKYSLDKLKDL